MLKVEHISVNYGEFQAISDVSMDMNKGEIVALLGSNGAGKSTTINTLSGMTELKSGKIIFMGKDISDTPAFDRVKMGIIQVPEGRKLFPFMTVMDNMLIGSYIKEAREARKGNLELCFDLFPKLYERRKQLAGSMSGGEQQMCAIARALMSNPKLLMLDEPSLGLAPVVVDKIFDVLLKINSIGVSVLIVEQNVLATLDVASRDFVIETGKTVLSGPSEELINNDDMKKAYLGI